MTDKITIERETLERVLDALETSLPAHHFRDMPRREKSLEAIETMRAALAAQPAEPVARVVPYGATAKLIWEDTAAARDCRPGPLYAAQPAPAEVPLTEEVLNIHKPYYSDIEWPCFKAGVRFAEMVHGTAATTCHVPPGWKLVPIEPTPEMVDAYLKANAAYWERIDQGPPKIGVWRNGTPREATAEAYSAMIAAGDKP